MALHLQKRGKTWQARGTVLVKGVKVTVRESLRLPVTTPETSPLLAERLAEVERAAMTGVKAGKAKGDGVPAVDPERATIDDVFEAYQKHIQADRGKPNHVAQTVQKVLARDYGGDCPVMKLSVGMMHSAFARGLKGRPTSINTVGAYGRIARAALNHVQKEYSWKIPKLEGVVPPGVDIPDHEKYLTKEERDQILQEIEEKWYSMWYFLCYTGARPIEARRLQWKHVIDRENGVSFAMLYHFKGGHRKDRLAELTQRTRELLGKRSNPEDHVFLYEDQRGRMAPWDMKAENAFGDAVRRAAERCGFEREYLKANGVSPGFGRHSFASVVYSATLDPIATARRLGHADLKMLDRYATSLGKRDMDEILE